MNEMIWKSKLKEHGFTRTEVLVLVGIVAFLAVLVTFRWQQTRAKLASGNCVANLGQIGLSMEIYANDNRGDFPARSWIEKSGSDDSKIEQPLASFLAISNYLSTPLVLHCPTDLRMEVQSWRQLSNERISYFLSMSATREMTSAILAGDRNLEVAGRPIPSGFFSLTTNIPLSWTREMHSRTYHTPCGNLLLSDFSVDTVKAAYKAGTWGTKRHLLGGARETLQENLMDIVRGQKLATNLVAIP